MVKLNIFGGKMEDQCVLMNHQLDMQWVTILLFRGRGLGGVGTLTVFFLQLVYHALIGVTVGVGNFDAEIG